MQVSVSDMALCATRKRLSTYMVLVNYIAFTNHWRSVYVLYSYFGI